MQQKLLWLTVRLMRSDAKTVASYLSELPPERREALTLLRKTVLTNLPKGYVEVINWGNICYEVPFTTKPDTYNNQPLMYVAIANQKNYMAIYLCGLARRMVKCICVTPNTVFPAPAFTRTGFVGKPAFLQQVSWTPESGKRLISHETIYRFIYAQLTRTNEMDWRHYLPRAKFKRGRRGHKGASPANFIKDRVSIWLLRRSIILPH